jgi:hypothetical protein
VLLAVLAVAVVWSLGDRLYIAGHPTIHLPWSLLQRLPLFNQLLPARIVMFVALVCALIVAMWLAMQEAGKARRWCLALVAVVFLLPNTAVRYLGTTATAFHARLTEPSFFADGLYRRELRPGETVLPIPFGQAGLSMLWQARTGMYFRMASGYFGPPPPNFAGDPIVPQLLSNAPGPAAPAELRSFIVRRNVTAVIADSADAGPWPPVLAKLGLRPILMGAVLLYRIPRTVASSRAASGSTS